MPQANTKPPVKPAGTPADRITKVFSADVEITGDREVTAKISTIAVDRDGEVLVPQGMNAKEFMLNPIVYLNHNYWDVPNSIMGQCTALKREKDSVVAKTRFATRPQGYPADKEWLPDTIFDLCKQGVIRGFSVGFVSNESRAATDRDLTAYGANCRRVTSKWTLHEYSVAPLPCNQEAIALAVSKGLLTAERAKQLLEDSPAVTADAKADETDDPPGNGEQSSVRKSDTATCSKCEKEFEIDDLEEIDGELVCKTCRDAKAATATPSAMPPATPLVDVPARLEVIAEVSLPDDAKSALPVNVVVFDETVALKKHREPRERVVREIVVEKIAKHRGRIYLDK